MGRLLDEARSTADVAKRRDLHGAVWKMVGVEERIVYLWTTRNIAGLTKRIAGCPLPRRRARAAAGRVLFELTPSN